MTKPGSTTSLDEPVFLLASERSGTNMTRAIFGAHPDIAAPTSPHLLMNLRPDQSCYGPLERDRNFRRFCSDLCRILDHQLGEWRVDLQPREILENAPSRTLMGAIDYAYRRERDERDADRVFFKENEAFYHVRYILHHYPNATFIYLVRDGRDMVLSYRRSLSHFGSITDGADVWRAEQRRCLRHLSEPDLRERIHPVHYEDILAYPEESVREMCDFIGVDFHPDQMAFHEQRKNRQAADAVHSWDNISNPIMRSNYGKYRDGFSDAEIETIESVLHRELYQTGYPLEGSMEDYVDSGGWTDTISKGYEFIRQVVSQREMMDLDEFQMRRERVHVFSDMQQSLETEHMERMLTCRALDST